MVEQRPVIKTLAQEKKSGDYFTRNRKLKQGKNRCSIFAGQQDSLSKNPKQYEGCSPLFQEAVKRRKKWKEIKLF